MTNFSEESLKARAKAYLDLKARAETYLDDRVKASQAPFPFEGVEYELCIQVMVGFACEVLIEKAGEYLKPVTATIEEIE